MGDEQLVVWLRAWGRSSPRTALAARTLEAADRIESMLAENEELVEKYQRACVLLYAVQLKSEPGAVPMPLRRAIEGMGLADDVALAALRTTKEGEQ